MLHWPPRPRSDVLVFPENHAELLRQAKQWPNRKIAFFQNQFMAHRGLKGATCYSELAFPKPYRFDPFQRNLSTQISQAARD